MSVVMQKQASNAPCVRFVRPQLQDTGKRNVMLQVVDFLLSGYGPLISTSLVSSSVPVAVGDGGPLGASSFSSSIMSSSSSKI